MQKLKDFTAKHYWQLITLSALLVVAGFTHGINMFHFPYYENDEGTYISQAWSLLRFGKIAPYTYWYDHAPVGWMFMAIWFKLVGFFTFGTSVNTGRVLMLIIHLISSTLIYYITWKYTQRKLAGILAVLLFSISPLAIYFQRRVLLDNIMIMWVLISWSALLRTPIKLRNAIISALAFGIAVLTKENAIFLIPAFIYLIMQQSSNLNKKFAILQWIVVMAIPICLYFLYAILKKEFFPVGWWGNDSEHVSLVTSFLLQLNRGSNLPFWEPRSDFYLSMEAWLTKDQIFITIGAIATIVGSLLSLWVPRLRVASFMVLMMWIFLIRGKLVIEFYVVPLIPLLAIQIGLLADHLVLLLSRFHTLAFNTISALVITLLLILYLPTSKLHYYFDETSHQVAAIEWIKQNAHPEDFIVIDCYAYVDLHESRFPGDPVFEKADWFWKIYYDPEIYTKRYNQDWTRINYITLSHEMLKQIQVGSQDFIKQALDHSSLVEDYTAGSRSYIDIPNYISTNGDWMQIYRVEPPNQRPSTTLNDSWEFYQEKFIEQGRVVDPARNNSTISEGQSYALLRAVYQDDQEAFEQIWNWTREHLQVRDDSLFAWIWAEENGEFQVTDYGNATDGDLDIALALIFAGKQWNNQVYLEHARQIVDDIWQQTVTQIDGKFYLLPMAQAERPTGYLLNPSYFSPAHYRIFAEIDKNPDHHWNLLADDTYKILNEIANNPGNKIKLPANWYVVDKDTGALSSASPYLDDNRVDSYGYDAFRVVWRVALEHKWFQYYPARQYLETVSPWFAQQWTQKQLIESVYSSEGMPLVDYQSISTTTAPVIALKITNPALSHQIYNQYLAGTYQERGYWENPNAYYDQNWAWFTEAFYTDQFPNLAK